MGVIPNGNQPDPSKWAELEANTNNRMAEQFQRMTAQLMRDRESEQSTERRDNNQNTNRLAIEGMRQAGNMAYLGQQQNFSREQSDRQAGEQSRRATGSIANEEMVRLTYEGFRNQGLSHDGALAMVGEVGRENSFNPSLIFGTHADPHNGATNAGLFSWQGARRPAMMAAMQEAGLVENGRIVPGQASVNAMAKFAVDEMRQRGEGDIVNRLMQSNVDMQQAARDLGTRTIRWRYNDPVYAAHHGRRDSYIANARAMIERRQTENNQTAGSSGLQLPNGAQPQMSNTLEQFNSDRTAPFQGQYFAPTSAPDGWTAQAFPEGNQPVTRPGRNGSTQVLHLPDEVATTLSNNRAPRDQFGRIASSRNSLAPIPPERPSELALPQTVTQQAQPQQAVAPGNAAILGSPANVVTAPNVATTTAAAPRFVRVDGRLVEVPQNSATRQ